MNNTAEIIKHLQGLQKEIDTTKKTISNREGQIEQLWASLKKYSIINEKQLMARLKELEVEKKKLEIDIPKLYDKLKQNYEW